MVVSGSRIHYPDNLTCLESALLPELSSILSAHKGASGGSGAREI